MVEQSTPSADPAAWSVTKFERFWSDPQPLLALVPAGLTDDIVAYFAGRDEPVRRKQPYTDCIAALVEALPGIYITLREHASNGDRTFVHWIMHATGENGPFELTGVNLIRTRDGLVAENLIVFDTSAFEARSGKKIPWA